MSRDLRRATAGTLIAPNAARRRALWAAALAAVIAVGASPGALAAATLLDDALRAGLAYAEALE